MADICADIERLGKGLGSSSRYRIVEALFDGPLTVGEIVKRVKQSQPAVSQHLKTLKGCNIVDDERRGQEVYYSLNSQYILALLKKLTAEVKNKKG